MFSASSHAIVSICEKCRNMREVSTARSRFLLCELALTDKRYAKYPRQPVVHCNGFAPDAESSATPLE